MLYLVLVLVIAAFALLIAALTTANTLWAWISVGISVVAAVLLLFDWVRGRRKVAAMSAPRRVEEPRTEPARTEQPPAPAESTTQLPPVDRAPAEADPNAEPAEEGTDAADLLVISELSDEVLVVDEHPRYHLADCAWLSTRSTIPLPVSEARQLGFTPCARCGPDAALAARHRAGKGAER